MTTPGLTQPPVQGSFVVGGRYGSDITEESAKATMTGRTKQVWSGAKTNFLDLAFGGFVNGIAGLINSLLGGIFKTSTGQPQTGGIVDLIGGFVGKHDSIGQASSDATAAIDKAQEAASKVAAQGAQVQAVKAAILQFQDGLPLRPFSHSMTNSEMTFDRVDIGRTSSLTRINGTTLPESGSISVKTGDGATANSSSSDVYTSFVTTVDDGLFTPATNSVHGGFIRAEWGGQRESFTLAVGPVSSPCSLRCVVAKMDPDNGNLTVLWVSDDLQTTIGNTAVEYISLIPNGIVIADRETIFVGVHQYGSGNPRPLYSKKVVGPTRDGLLYPAKQNARFGLSSPLTAGQTVQASSLAFDSVYLPWVGVGLSLTIPVPPATSLYESFDDNVMPAALVYKSGAPSTISNGTFFYNSSNDGDSVYLHTKRLNRNNHFVEGAVVNPTNRIQMLCLRSDSSGFNRIAMAVADNGVQILRRGSQNTQLANISMSVTNGTVLRFSVIGNVYSVHRITGESSTLLLQYTDSTNALPVGADARYITIGTSRALFGNSGGWAYLLASDFPD
ncbi:hypothetical protein ACWEQ4_01335 [Rhodococcus sp. NPDC003994]